MTSPRVSSPNALFSPSPPTECHHAMGICASCFRRRRRSRNFHGYDDEREPLLHQKETTRQDYWASRTRKVLECVDALKAGKLPSQDQLEALIRTALTSDVLRDKRDKKLSAAGRGVVASLRELGKAAIEFGEDKNHDNKIQNIVYNVRQLRTLAPPPLPNVEARLNIPTNELVHDVHALLSSSESLIRLLVTSTTFRLLISNLVLLTRQMLANVAQDVERVAETAENLAKGVEKAAEGVEAVAQSVEKTAERVADAALEARPGNVSEVDEAKDAIGSTLDEIREVEFDQPKRKLDKGKGKARSQTVNGAQAAIESVREILIEAHKNPEHLAALRTILALSEKYAERAQRGVVSVHDTTLSTSPIQTSSPLTAARDLDPSTSTTIEVDPSLPTSLRLPPIPSTSTTSKSKAEELLDDILPNVKTLLERFAGGRTLDTLVSAFGGVVLDMQAYVTQSVDEVIEEGVKNKADDEEIRRLRSFLSSLHEVVRRCLYENPEVYLTPRPGGQSPTPFSATPSSRSGAVKDEVEMSGETSMSRDVHGLLREWSTLTGSRQRHKRVDEEHDSSPDTGSHSNLDILLSECSSFIHALENDPATLRFVHALQGLEVHFQEYMAQFANTAGEIIHQGTSKAQDAFYTLWTDIIGFIIPRVLGSVLSSTFRAKSGVPIPLPLPRVEVKSPGAEGVVDPRGMTVFLEQGEPDGYETFEEEEYWWGRRASMISPDISQSQSLSSSVSALSVNSGGQARGYREDDDASDTERGGTIADLLTPRSVVMKRWSETRVDFGVVGEAAEAGADERTPLLRNADTTQKPKTQVQTMDRMHVTIDGLLTSTYHSHSTRRRVHTLELDNIAFYVKYTVLRILGYEDEGIANLDLDFAWGQNDEDSEGAKIDIDLEVDFDSLNELRDSPLKIQPGAIHVNLPASTMSLAIHPSIVQSQRHPILTTLLVNPTLWIIYMVSSYWARREIEVLLAEALKVGIEGSAKLIVNVWSLARRKAQARSDASETNSSMMMGDWYEVLVDVLRELVGTEQDQPETEVDISLKGVKVAIPRQNGDEEDNVEVAVGPVPQLLPEHAEPELPTVDQAVDGVVKGVQEGTDKVVKDVRDNVEAGVAVAQQQSKAALELVEGVAVGANQAQLRKEVEKKQKRVRYSMAEPPRRREREEWRSAVFDI